MSILVNMNKGVEGIGGGVTRTVKQSLPNQTASSVVSPAGNMGAKNGIGADKYKPAQLLNSAGQTASQYNASQVSPTLSMKKAGSNSEYISVPNTKGNRAIADGQQRIASRKSVKSGG